MARILFLVVAVAVEVYALVHWAYKSRVATPGGLNRFIWLLVILIVPFVGPVSWLGSYLVMVAEQHQRRRYRTNTAGNSVQRPPDDDPESLNRVVDRLKRRRGISNPGSGNQDIGDHDTGNHDSGNQSTRSQSAGSQDAGSKNTNSRDADTRSSDSQDADAQSASNRDTDSPTPSPKSDEDGVSN